MIEYERSISVFASKTTLCQTSWDKVAIKIHISHCKIAKNLGPPPTTIHNIVKQFRESREISVHIGQVRKPQVNVHDLWALIWQCIRNHLDATGFSGQELISDSQKTVEMCAVRWVHVSACSWEKQTSNSQSQWPKGPSRFYQRQMQKQMFVMVWGCSRANGMGDWHMCEGTIDMKAYIGIVQRHTVLLESLWTPCKICENVSNFNKIREIIQNACCFLFSTVLSKIFYIKDVYI